MHSPTAAKLARSDGKFYGTLPAHADGYAKGHAAGYARARIDTYDQAHYNGEAETKEEIIEKFKKHLKRPNKIEKTKNGKNQKVKTFISDVLKDIHGSKYTRDERVLRAATLTLYEIAAELDEEKDNPDPVFLKVNEKEHEDEDEELNDDEQDEDGELDDGEIDDENMTVEELTEKVERYKKLLDQALARERENVSKEEYIVEEGAEWVDGNAAA